MSSWRRASTLIPPAPPASRSARWTTPTAIPTGKTTHNTAHKRGQKHCPRFLLTAFFVKTILKSRIWSNVNILWTTFFGLFFTPFRADRRFEIDFYIVAGSRDNIRNVSCRIIHSFLNIYSCVCRKAAGSFNKLSAQFLCNAPVRFLIIFRNKGLYWIFAAVSCIFTAYSWAEFDNSYKYVQNADWYRSAKLCFRQ